MLDISLFKNLGRQLKHVTDWFGGKKRGCNKDKNGTEVPKKKKKKIKCSNYRVQNSMNGILKIVPAV